MIYLLPFYHTLDHATATAPGVAVAPQAFSDLDRRRNRLGGSGSPMRPASPVRLSGLPAVDQKRAQSGEAVGSPAFLRG